MYKVCAGKIKHIASTCTVHKAVQVHKAGQTLQCTLSSISQGKKTRQVIKYKYEILFWKISPATRLHFCDVW